MSATASLWCPEHGEHGVECPLCSAKPEPREYGFGVLETNGSRGGPCYRDRRDAEAFAAMFPDDDLRVVRVVVDEEWKP